MYSIYLLSIVPLLYRILTESLPLLCYTEINYYHERGFFIVFISFKIPGKINWNLKSSAADFNDCTVIMLFHRTYSPKYSDDFFNRCYSFNRWNYYPEPSKVSSLLSHPEFQILLAPYFTPFAQELTDWMNSSYDSNPQHTEHLIHRSTSGNLVRSKSEAMIDMVLYSHRIPFRYECALYLGNHPIFPDFTIRHPQTGETFYWEHFGMMDDALYAQNTASKLQLYISHGIIPSIHLITTYETKDHPLSIEVIQNTVEHYFL